MEIVVRRRRVTSTVRGRRCRGRGPCSASSEGSSTEGPSPKEGKEKYLRAAFPSSRPHFTWTWGK